MPTDVLIVARDPAFGGALTRLIELALEVKAEATESEAEAEDVLAANTPVLVMESMGTPADFAFLLRAWRIRPDAPVVICTPSSCAEAHRAFGPLAIVPAPAPPAPLLHAVRRAISAKQWSADSASPPVGLPAVMPVQMAPVDVMHMLRRDALTFNVWRETNNPNFVRYAPNEDMPQAAHSLARAFLPRANLSRVNLTRISLFGASLRESTGTFVQLEGADLREADLAGAVIVGSNLVGADLRGACFDQAELVACDLRGALMSETTLTHAMLVDCELDPPSARVTSTTA